MNILILNASPRPNGGIARMLQAMEEEALACGARVVNLRVADLKMRPCTGCMTCRTAQRCTLPEDDAQCVVRLLGECQVLVIGAPCYWGNMPGTLKALFDRMVYGLIEQSGTGLPRPLHAGKDAVLVSTSTTAFPLQHPVPPDQRHHTRPESHPEVERLPHLPPHRAGRGAAEARRRKRFESLQESDAEVVQIITTFVPLQTAM